MATTPSLQDRRHHNTSPQSLRYGQCNCSKTRLVCYNKQHDPVGESCEGFVRRSITYRSAWNIESSSPQIGLKYSVCRIRSIRSFALPYKPWLSLVATSSRPLRGIYVEELHTSFLTTLAAWCDKTRISSCALVNLASITFVYLKQVLTLVGKPLKLQDA